MWLIGPKEPLQGCDIWEESQDKAGLPGRRWRQSGGRREGPSGETPGAGSGRDETGKTKHHGGMGSILQGACAHLGQPRAPGQGRGQRVEGRGQRAEGGGQRSTQARFTDSGFSSVAAASSRPLWRRWLWKRFVHTALFPKHEAGAVPVPTGAGASRPGQAARVSSSARWSAQASPAAPSPSCELQPLVRGAGGLGRGGERGLPLCFVPQGCVPAVLAHSAPRVGSEPLGSGSGVVPRFSQPSGAYTDSLF